MPSESSSIRLANTNRITTKTYIRGGTTPSRIAAAEPLNAVIASQRRLFA